MANKLKTWPRMDFSMMPPYDLQRDIINDPARFKVVAIGRQAGKSWLAKYTLLDKGANQGQRCWWVAPTISAAQTHWEDLLKLVEDIKFPTKKISRSLKQIDFLSGGSVRIRSAEIPDNLRGGSLDYIVLDEAAFMDGKVWNEVLFATLTATGGSAMFTTTPNGRNWLWEVYQLGEDPRYPMFKSWNAPTTVSPYQDPALLEVIRLTTPEYVWKQEYLAMFLEDAGGVFTKVKERSIVQPIYSPCPGSRYVAGLDWGLSGDWSVFTVIDKYTRQQVFGTRFTGIGTIPQLEKIKALIDLWEPESLMIELNGIGKPMFDMLKATLGLPVGDLDLHHISGHDENGVPLAVIDEMQKQEVRYNNTILRTVTIDNETKREYVERLAADIEFGRLFLLDETQDGEERYARTQINEMSTFIRKRTDSGLNITYEAQVGQHDDTVSALYLAYSQMPKVIIPVPNHKRKVQRVKMKNPFR